MPSFFANLHFFHTKKLAIKYKGNILILGLLHFLTICFLSKGFTVHKSICLINAVAFDTHIAILNYNLRYMASVIKCHTITFHDYIGKTFIVCQ